MLSSPGSADKRKCARERTRTAATSLQGFIAAVNDVHNVAALVRAAALVIGAAGKLDA
jgi:hypothetical protein